MPLGTLPWDWDGMTRNAGSLTSPNWTLRSMGDGPNPGGNVGAAVLPTWNALEQGATVSCPPE